MKAAFTLALLALPLLGYGQFIAGKSIPSYTTKLGTAIHVGDTLTLGRGQRDNGSFKYATIPPNILVTSGMPVPAFWSTKKIIVRDIKEVVVKNSLNRDVSIVFKSGAYNARLDADAAEESGELITARTPQRPGAASAPSVADELLKLKSLLDAKAITQAEYDAQKAKLLAR